MFVTPPSLVRAWERINHGPTDGQRFYVWIEALMNYYLNKYIKQKAEHGKIIVKTILLKLNIEI